MKQSEDHLTERIDQAAGCLLGLATGDALGAPYEGGPAERLLWLLIGRTRHGARRWTDDTQMAIDLAESLMERESVGPDVRPPKGGTTNGAESLSKRPLLDPDALAKRFAHSYRWSRGYGPGMARVLKRIRRGEPWESASRAVYPEGSYGNGAAMRAPVLALFFDNRDDLISAARTSAQITHPHPLGIEGTVLVALAVHGLLQRAEWNEILDAVQSHCTTPEFTSRLQTVESWLAGGHNPTPREVARTLGNRMTAVTSCPTALYIALRHLDRSFSEMMQYIIKCRGDVDTIGAMAGAMWGIHNGPAGLPELKLERRGEIVDLATRITERRLIP